MFRVGLLADLRSRCLGGKTIGVMVTASHNAAHDNGVKLVDPLGEMLEQAWEAYATDLANASSHDALADTYLAIATRCNIVLTTPANVVFARDTRCVCVMYSLLHSLLSHRNDRPSGPALIKALTDALDACRTSYVDHGIQTTPQLHYITRCINDPAYGQPTEQGYFTKFASAYRELLVLLPVSLSVLRGVWIDRCLQTGKPPVEIAVDCANGVGALKLRDLAKEIGQQALRVQLVNTAVDEADKLNHDVCAWLS